MGGEFGFGLGPGGSRIDRGFFVDWRRGRSRRDGPVRAVSGSDSTRVGTGLPRPRPSPVSAGVSCPGRFCFQSAVVAVARICSFV